MATTPLQFQAPSGETTTVTCTTLADVAVFSGRSATEETNGSGFYIVNLTETNTGLLRLSVTQNSIIVATWYVKVDANDTNTYNAGDWGHVNVEEWLGNAVTASSGNPDVNVESIDDIDAPATWQASMNGQMDTALTDYDAVVPADLPTNFGDLSITATTGRVDVASIEGSDATDQIRDAVVDDATRIDASALNTASTAVGSDGTGLTEAGGTGDQFTAITNVLGTPSNFGSGTSTLAANLEDLADNGTATFDRSTDSLQALRDHIGDGTNLTEAGGDGDHLTEAGGDGDHLTEAGGDGDHLTEAGGTGDHLTGIPGLSGLTVATGTIGATGNDTTHVHLDGLGFGNDELNDLLLVIFDNSTSEYHSRWIEDWADTGDLATVATLPFTPENSTDTYTLLGIRRNVTAETVDDKTGYSISGTLTTLDALDTAQDSQHSTTQSAVATAQADLDTLTGADGATLATSQPNYAPAVAGDAMDLVTDALDAAALATDAVTEIQSGLSTFDPSADDVTLADGVVHGGSTARLVLGTSSSSAALDISSSGTGNAVKLSGSGTGTVVSVATATANHAVHLQNTKSAGSALTLIGTTAGYGLFINAAAEGISFFDEGIYGDITGDITGNLSGSVGSVTGGINTTGGTITTLDGLDTAQDTQHASTQSDIAALNDLSSAEAQTAANAALVANHLDHLLAADYDPAAKPGVATALLNELVESDAGVSRFTQNALEQGPDTTTGLALSSSGLAAVTAWTVDITGDLSGSVGSVTGGINTSGGTITTLDGLDTAQDTQHAATQSSLSDVETDTQDIQSRLPSALVSGRMSSDAVAISGSTDAADKLEASAETIVTGAATSTTLSTTQMSTDLTETTDEHYNGRVVIWTSGNLLYQATDITSYDGSSGTLTFTAVTEAPSNGDTFVIV